MSLQVSFVFGVVGTIMSIDVIRREIKKQILPWSSSLYILYTCMAWLQWSQYYMGTADTAADCDATPFGGINSKLTFAAHVLVWLQPILHNYCLVVL